MYDTSLATAENKWIGMNMSLLSCFQNYLLPTVKQNWGQMFYKNKTHLKNTTVLKK